jgi:biotin carboxylase
MNNNLQNRRLLILGGNPETKTLVDLAKEMGVFTIVADPNPLAPAKKTASIKVNVDGMDVDAIVNQAKKYCAEGVLVGVADILVPTYQRVCEELGFPCYATPDIIAAFSSKDGFIATCKSYGVSTIPTFALDDLSNIDYPVIVKPVDNGAGVGMSICNTPQELASGIDKALYASLRKRIVIERYMQCDDLFAYYNFIDGKPYLAALADRFTCKASETGSPVCIGARYPSAHLIPFKEVVHPKLIEMFQGLGIRNGVLNLQFFYDGNNFYAYDPGFRLQGEAPHLHLLAANGFDNREMLVNFALTGSMYGGDFASVNDVQLNKQNAVTVWVLLKQGAIHSIDGIEYVKSLSSFKFLLQRFFVDDEVSEDMLGTERQVFCRIYLQHSDLNVLDSDIRSINKNLCVETINSESMIVDMLNMHGESSVAFN